MSRACTTCGVVKSLDGGFRKDARYHDGYTRQCNECKGLVRRERYHAAPDREREQSRVYDLAHRDVRRQRERQLRFAAVVAYGGSPPTCACCGETELAFLSLDHIDGGGRQQRRQLGGGGFYTWLRRMGYPPGLRVLCHNCNQGRRVTGGTCPHETRVTVGA